MISTSVQEPNPQDEYAPMTPDPFFSERQIVRLRELMDRVQGAEAPPEEVLSAEDYAELQTLIKAELRASAQRAAALLGRTLA